MLRSVPALCTETTSRVGQMKTKIAIHLAIGFLQIFHAAGIFPLVGIAFYGCDDDEALICHLPFIPFSIKSHHQLFHLIVAFSTS